MNRAIDDLRITRRLAVLLLLACLGAALCAWRERPVLTLGGPLLLLATLALVAEFVPVELPRRGVRITFALPFVAAVAVFVGGTMALVVDVVATLLVSGVRMRAIPRATELKWIAANGAISATSAGMSALVLAALRVHAVPAEALEIVFIACYAAINLFLVGYVEWVLTDRAWSENTSAMSGTAGLGLALYSMVGLVVAVLVHEQLYLCLPLTLVPVWALRTGLSYKARMDEVYYETIAALTQMLQRAHPYTHGHLERVSRTAEEVAFRLGLSARRARQVREAAVLHDIGKIAVNEEILDKPGKLTPEELAHVRLHSSFGAAILEPVGPFAAIVPWVRHHHERPDGCGYPDALPNAAIPIESKIIAVVDAFDAMVDDEGGIGRSYREPMSQEAALEELARCSGTQFDVAVVEAFRAVLTRGGA